MRCTLLQVPERFPRLISAMLACGVSRTLAVEAISNWKRGIRLRSYGVRLAAAYHAREMVRKMEASQRNRQEFRGVMFDLPRPVRVRYSDGMMPKGRYRVLKGDGFKLRVQHVASGEVREVNRKPFQRFLDNVVQVGAI